MCSFTVEDFTFLAFSNKTADDPCLTSDGLFGLTPIDYDHNGHSLIRALFEGGVISETSATLSLNYWPGRTDDAENTMTLGGIPNDLSVSNFVSLETRETFGVVAGTA